MYVRVRAARVHGCYGFSVLFATASTRSPFRTLLPSPLLPFLAAPAIVGARSNLPGKKQP